MHPPLVKAFFFTWYQSQTSLQLETTSLFVYSGLLSCIKNHHLGLETCAKGTSFQWMKSKDRNKKTQAEKKHPKTVLRCRLMPMPMPMPTPTPTKDAAPILAPAISANDIKLM